MTFLKLRPLSMAVLASALSLVAACGRSDVGVADGDASSEQDIVGGTVTRGFPAVGLLVNFHNGGDGEGICTATVVAHNTLLTAAHCVLNLDANGRPTAKTAHVDNLVYYAGYSLNAFNESQVYGVTGVTLPGGNIFPLADFVAGLKAGALSNFDMALVSLYDGPAVTPALLPQSAPASGQILQLVGYGNVKNYQGSGAGTKRVVKTPVRSLYNDFLLRAGTAQSGTCSGDSGGPALRNNVVVAVTQAGDVDAAGNCVGNDFFTRMDTFAPFIRANLR